MKPGWASRARSPASGPSLARVRVRCAITDTPGLTCSGAVCPKRGVGAAVVMPTVNVEAMSIHLAEISQRVSEGAHAVLVLDGAGWHTSAKLKLPANISLLPLPRYAPELNPVENLWEFLRANFLSRRLWESYDAIVDASCAAWNGLMRRPEQVTSITSRAWAQVKV